MKKLLISLLIFLASTFFVNNVSALTSYDFTTAYEYKADLAYVWLENGEVKSELMDKSLIDRIKNYMDSRGKYYIISFYNPSYYVEPYPYNDQYYTEILIYEFDSVPTLSVNSTGIFKTSINGYEYHVYSDKDSYNETVNSIDSYISFLESISLSDNISTSTNKNILYTSYIDSNIPPDRNNSRIIYYSNFDIIYNSQDDIIIGDYTISAGDKFITLSDYKQLTEEENDDVHVFPSIEPLEGFERYAVISTNYNYNSGGISTTGEPNYYLLYFNQNFTYDGNSSRELLWPDNTNLSSVNLLLYNISNNSWQPLITNLVYFAFPGAYSTASYNTKVVYSNFDIYYKDSDEIYFKSSIDSPSEPIEYIYNYINTFNSNATDTNGVITQIIQEHPSYVTGKENYNYSTKIELIPNDPDNPIVPNLVNVELLYEYHTNGMYIPVSEMYPDHTQDEVLSYEVKTEYGITSVYTYINAGVMPGYKIIYTFSDSDNVTYNIYDSRVETDVYDPLYYYPISAYFEGYQRITFDVNNTHLFLSSKNNQSFKIYIPTYSLNSNNQDVKVSSYNYNTQVTSYLSGSVFSENSYFTEFIITVDHENTLIGSVFKDNGKVVIYVPNDVYVGFYNYLEYGESDVGSIPILTPDGFLDIEIIVSIDEQINSWLGYINNYLSTSSDTINYVSNIIQMFFNDMPIWLNTFFIIAWIFILLKVTIVLGGWK